MRTKQEADKFIQENYFPETSSELEIGLEQAKVVYEETGKELDKAYEELKQAIEEYLK